MSKFGKHKPGTLGFVKKQFPEVVDESGAYKESPNNKEGHSENNKNQQRAVVSAPPVTGGGDRSISCLIYFS